MRAMILAAGRGERMRELTQETPKPLLRVAGHYLIEYAIANLSLAGIKEIVINVSYQAEQIQRALGEGERYGVKLSYSQEKERLETGGGVLKALPLLGREAFLVVSSDIITDYPFKSLLSHRQHLAHVVVVDNRPFHPQGDFGLQQGLIVKQAEPTFTYANMGLFKPELFTAHEPGRFPLRDVLIPAIERGQVTGEYYQGLWHNVGTPEDLEKVNEHARQDANLQLLVTHARA